MEENDGTASVVFTVPFWVEAMKCEVSLFCALVDDRFRVLEQLFIADSSNGWDGFIGGFHGGAFSRGFGFTSERVYCAMLCMIQKRFFLILSALLLVVGAGMVYAQGDNPHIQSQLSGVYDKWRTAMINQDVRAWAATTSKSRQLAVRNRVYSERRPFPKAVFQLPAAPPSVANLKGLSAHKKGATATAVYFGKVDFGMGGDPAENLLLLHFVNEGGVWKYDTADFINLMALPKVRKQLKEGDLSYVEQKDFQASGILPKMPIAVNLAKYIAKVYVFCPGREVKMKVNKVSDHRFQDTKASEVVIGGGKDGINEVQFSTKSLEGSTGKEALSIRVYLMSTVPGTKPIKMFEYQVNEGEPVKVFGSENFIIDEKIAKRLNG